MDYGEYSQVTPDNIYHRVAEISIESNTEFYKSISADPRRGSERERFETEGYKPSRLEHIESHMVDLKRTLGVKDTDEGLQRLAEIAQTSDPNSVDQFVGRHGREFKYHRQTNTFLVIQTEPRGIEKKPPPPPAYIVTAYPLRNEADFEVRRLKNQKGLPKEYRQRSVVQ